VSSPVNIAKDSFTNHNKKGLKFESFFIKNWGLKYALMCGTISSSKGEDKK
jgi:hypothetical protein